MVCKLFVQNHHCIFLNNKYFFKRFRTLRSYSHNPEIIHITKECYSSSYSSQLNLLQSIGMHSGHSFAVWEQVQTTITRTRSANILIMWFGLWTHKNLEWFPLEANAKHIYFIWVKTWEYKYLSYYIPGKDKDN